jgi:hypothetical protein
MYFIIRNRIPLDFFCIDKFKKIKIYFLKIQQAAFGD